MATPFVESLDRAAADALIIFSGFSKRFTREEFESESFDDSIYAKAGIYEYQDEHGTALYIGRTKRRIKARLKDVTSPHSQKEWWPMWKYVCVLPMYCPKEQFWLEAFLILGLRPQYNKEFNSDLLDKLIDVIEGEEAEEASDTSPA